MFEKLKNIFHKTNKTNKTNPIPTQKPIIITIHGYGRRRSHEFDNLVLWGEKDGFEIITFDMYNLFDENDCNWKDWIQRAKNMVNQYQQSGREIYLVGFSMGGVIASYLASIYSVKKLILLAPAFQYINIDTVTDALVKSYNSLVGNEKKDTIPMSKNFYQAFTDVIKNLKNAIEEVQCPTLLIHGDEDEVISVKSSLNAYEKIKHNQKKCIILHKGHHRLLMDTTINWECYQLMKLFLQDQIVLHEQKEQAVDVMDELIETYKKYQLRKDKEQTIS